MARPRRGTTAGPEQVVERAINQTNPGLEEHRTRVRRFNSHYDIWRGVLANERDQTPTQRRQTNQQSRMRVKFGMQVIDQALVNIVQGVPKAKVTARTPNGELKATAMKKLLDYYADLDHLGELEATIAQQALIYGVSPAKIHWLYCTHNGQVVDDRPTLEPWDAYMIWWDPLAKTVQEASYLVLESYKTREELEQGRYNDADGTGRWRNLDLLYSAPEAKPRTPTSQNQLRPQPQGAYRGHYRIWEVWRRMADGIRLTCIGNEQILLFDGPSPYRMNSYPVTISNSRPDLFKIEGVSESELVDHLQQALWTVQNLRMEQLKTTVMRPFSVRATTPDIDSIIMRPNARWVVNDHDDIFFHAMPPLPPEAYTEDQTLLSYLQYVTGITPYVGGASGTTSGVDQTTATGVSLLTESASRLLAFKARQIQERTWQRTFEMWGELCKQYVRSPVWVRVTGPGDEVTWEPVAGEDIDGDFDIRIEAGEDSALTQRERADAIALLNALAPFAQMGVVNLRVILERVAKAFNVANPETLFQQPPAIPPAAPTGANGNGANGGRPLLLGTGMGGQEYAAGQPSMSTLVGNQ